MGSFHLVLFFLVLRGNQELLPVFPLEPFGRYPAPTPFVARLRVAVLGGNLAGRFGFVCATGRAKQVLLSELVLSDQCQRLLEGSAALLLANFCDLLVQRVALGHQVLKVGHCFFALFGGVWERLGSWPEGPQAEVEGIIAA